MKKIALIMSILSALFIISCSGNGESDTETGYVDPGSWSGKDVSDLKKYTINGVTQCVANAQCNAIIYENRLNDIDYVGIAVNNAHENTPPTFRLKIYWEAVSTTSLPASGSKTIDLSPSEYTIKISQGTNEYTSPDANLNITIDNEGDGTYTITFINHNIIITDPEDSSTFTINSSNNITAEKYP